MKLIHDHRISFSVGIALAIHCLILILPFESFSRLLDKASEKAASSTLEIRLTHLSPQPEKNELETAPERPVDEIAVSQPDEPLSPEEIEQPDSEVRFNRDTIISSARSELSQNQKVFKSFSKSDFLVEKKPLETNRPSSLPILLTRASHTSSRSFSGQSTDLIRNADGDAMCWQQRGIPGESQQWYRVPLALCGHLD